jgi:putative ABC transport system permease protein
MTSILQDVRAELRRWRKNPGYTMIMLLMLALGTGANAVMFSVIDSVLLRPLPYTDSSRLVSLGTVNPDGPTDSISWLNFKDLRSQAQSFSDMAAYDELETAVQIPNQEPVHVTVVESTANLFQMLGIHPMMGRDFLPDEDQDGKPCVAILSASFWRNHLQARESILGEKIVLSGTPCSVVGVMPAEFNLPPHDPAVWFTLHPAPAVMNRSIQFLEAIGRMKPGTSTTLARQELDVISKRMASAYKEDEGTSVSLTSYQEKVTKKIRPGLLAMQGAVGLLLLITCANVASLQLAGALSRRREFAIRSALGAGRMQIIWQLLTEKLLLAFVATALGLVIAYSSLGILKHLGAEIIPRINELSIHGEVYLAMLGVSVLTAAIFGLAPLFHSTGQEIEQGLRENGTAVSGGRSKQVFRDALVVTQLGLAVLLLASSGLLMRALLRLLNEDRGFVAQQTLRLQTSPSTNIGKGRDLTITLYGPELEKIKAVPGVKTAAFVTYLPLTEEAGNTHAGFNIVGRPPASENNAPLALLNAISEDYFRVLEITLLRGRFFQQDDNLDHPQVAIVNDAFTKKYMEGDDPLGKQIRLGGDAALPPVTIVGIVHNTRQQTLALPPEPEIYLSFRQIQPNTIWENVLLKQIMTYIVRIQGNPLAPSRAIQAAIHEVDPDQAVYHVESMEDVIDTSVSTRRLGLTLVVVLAVLALVVACAGVWSVLSHAVGQRTREIAVRIAVGATRKDMMRMVMLRALWLCVIGLGIGVACAVMCGYFLMTLLAGIHPWDPPALLISSLILVLVTILASLFPALRAASVEPVQALKAE